MYKLFMYFCLSFFSLLNVVFLSYANVDIKSLPYCSSNIKENLDKIVYVSTLDGKITALNANENGSILWEFKTGDKDMLSSTIHNRELTNTGSWVRMIPSLSGSLYKFDGENIDLVPVTADELLTSSFKYSDDLVFAGGKEMLTYGVGLKSGQLIYKCDITGCHNETNLDKSIDKDDILIIQKKQQTVHAISPDNGSERWNFSVAQHEIKAVKSTECHANEKFNLDLIIKVVLPEGLIFAVSETNMNQVLWIQKLDSPITNAWQWINNELKPVEIFTGSQWSWNKEAQTFSSPSIYIGMHKKQLYIQESAIMQSIAYDYVINFKQNYMQNKFPPKIPWKPYPVSSASVTALMPKYDDDESSEEKTDIVSEIGTTSLAVLYASKYINGHGYYLYSDTDLKENEDMACDKSNNSDSPPLNSSEESDFFFDDETPVQIIIVSLWFWWKEVVVISVTTAFVVNFILARRFLNTSQIQEGVQQEIIFIERHVQIPFDENADKKEMIRHSSESSNSGVDISSGNDLPFNSRFLTDFDIIHCLGRGGFGMVFEARNKIDEWNYAVKQINLPNRHDSRQRVMREVKALAKLDHRNIVRYYNAWLEFPPADWQSNVMSCILDIPHSTFESPTEDSISIAEAPGENYNKIDICNDNDEDDSFIVFGDNSNDSNSDSVSKHRNTSQYNNFNSKNNQIVPKNSTNIIEIVNKSDISQSVASRAALNAERRMYLYIQMQLCQKESLKDWMLKNVVRDPNSIKVIFEQILSAVEYVHLQGLIHRDLKPSNIFFSLDGEIKIGDFGLVTAMDDDEYVPPCDTNTLAKTKFKKHTREVGTQLYMSPEQVKGSFYNYKVDIYSLGVIFFELLTPFSTEMERHKTLSELRFNKFPDSFHKKFQHEHDLLKLMLATKPEKRPTTYGIRCRPPFNHTIEDTKWHFELPPRQGTVK